MDKSRISIVIPVYNSEDYLDRCLSSILRQNFASYEVILVDDGSTDSSPLICDRYSATDPRFRTIHRVNGGVSSARNAGLAVAKGEYVMFVDSDDFLEDGALDAMTSGLAGEDFVLGGFVEYVDAVPGRIELPTGSLGYGKGTVDRFLDTELRRNCVLMDAPWAKLFRRKVLSGMSFREELSYAEDKLFVFEFLSVCETVRTVKQPVYSYCVRGGSLGSDLRSDRHLQQLRTFLPLYAEVLASLQTAFPRSVKAARLYREDLIGRYICRILNIFATRKTRMLDAGFVAELYSMMAQDEKLGVFSLRPGQVFNLLLYRIGSPEFSAGVYRMIAFRRK